MTDQDVRDFLERMATEEPTSFLDATPLIRLAHRRAARTVIVGAIGVAIAIAVLFTGVGAIRSAPVPADDLTPTPAPSADLGIFTPVAGRIVYGDRFGIWGVDPAAPADTATRIQVTSEPGIPLGWSSDGTRLLIMQMIRGEEVVAGRWDSLRLLVLHADGSETQVAERHAWIPGATISPDGSRVVFATYEALYSVDVGGGPAEVLLDSEDMVYEPTFSPDGAKIAYVVGSGDYGHRVWVMDADGSDAHQIVSNETTRAAGHVFGLAWSPAGDRIAFGNDVATYTFAPDGSGFTQVITDGHRPYWSPDGSQLAYKIPCGGCGLAIADADGSNVHEFGFTNSGPWHPAQPEAVRSTPSVTISTLAPTGPMSDELVLRLHSWRQGFVEGFVELAVYADGRVIWVPSDQRGYLQMRLSPKAVEWLRAKAVSTGLFENDLALGLDLRWGDLEVHRGDRSVFVAWGKTGKRVGTAPIQGRFVDATPAQADSLIELEAFFRDPFAWALPNDMYVQPGVSPFVPTHLWAGWDRSMPDPSRLPSPAREVVTTNLEAVLDGSCGVITIAQAQAIADAMEQAGLIGPDDVTDGIEFDMPGQGAAHSLFHASPALPDESTCD